MRETKSSTGTESVLHTIRDTVRAMKQEKLCEAEDMMPEELGVENAKLRQVGGSHYKDMPIQPWDVIDNYPFEQAVGFYRGTIEAYIMRAGHKGPALEDYEKALHTLEKLVAFIKSRTS